MTDLVYVPQTERILLEELGLLYPEYLGSGSVHDVNGDVPDERGLYLPNGTWKKVDAPKRRMGFTP